MARSTDTLRLRLRVVPGARQTTVVGRHGDGWKLRVAAPPEDGRANRAVQELLGRALGVAAADVRIVRGATARDKEVEVAGVSAGAAEAALQQASESR